MGKKDKLIRKIKSRPKDFTFDEAVTLLEYFNYVMCNKGVIRQIKCGLIPQIKNDFLRYAEAL